MFTMQINTILLSCSLSFLAAVSLILWATIAMRIINRWIINTKYVTEKLAVFDERHGTMVLTYSVSILTCIVLFSMLINATSCETHHSKYMNNVYLRSDAKDLCEKYMSNGQTHDLDCKLSYQFSNDSIEMEIFENGKLLETIQF